MEQNTGHGGIKQEEPGYQVTYNMRNRIIEFDPPIWGTDYNNEKVEVIAMGYFPEIDNRKHNDLGYGLDDFATEDDPKERAIWAKHLYVSVRLDGSGLERATSCLYALGEMGVTLNQDELFKDLSEAGIIMNSAKAVNKDPLVPILFDSWDWKQKIDLKRLNKFMEEASLHGGFYHFGEVDVWTGDERIWLAAPPEVFKWLQKKKQCGMELFLDAACIGDEVSIDNWFWHTEEKRLWVNYKWRGELHLLPMDEWDLISQNYPWE
jgi:hypothetical protein